MMEPVESDRLLGRNGAIWVAYCRGKTQEALAQEHGISQARVSQIIRKVRDSIPELDRAEEVQRSLDLLHQLRQGALEIWDGAAAPVTAGKDGDLVQDPDTLEYVRDHGGRLAALTTALKVDGEIRKLLGLDAAQKVDLSVNAQAEARAEQLAREAAQRLAGNDTKELESNGDR
jgi:DNA-binding transcriptional regulator LsrR (DeoR family)